MKMNIIGSGLLSLASVVTCMDSIGRECGDLGPPPSILDMPPPPMPSFLAAVLNDPSGNNESNSPNNNNKELLMESNELEPGKPCKSMCETDQGVGFVELPQQGMTTCGTRTCDDIFCFSDPYSYGRYFVRLLYIFFPFSNPVE